MINRKPTLIFIALACLLFSNIMSASACTLSLGFAPEEHKANVARFMPSHKLRQSSYLAVFKQFKALTGCTLIWKRYKNMDALKAALINKTLDVGWLKLFNSYIVHKRNPMAYPIFTDLSKDKQTQKLSPYYNSYIVTLAGKKGLQNLSEIRPDNIVFLHPHSASGFIYPIMFLIKRHILTIQNAKQSTFIDNYDDLYNSLFDSSKIKVIATWDNVILRDTKVKPIKILKAIHGLPNPAYVESHPLPLKIKKALFVTLKQFVKARAVSPLTAQQGLVESSTLSYKKAYRLFDRYCKILPKYCY